MTEPAPKYGYDRRGNPIDEAYVDEAVREAEAGYDISTLRPVDLAAVLGAALPMPDAALHIDDDLHARAAAAARSRGCTVTQLVREALEQYLAS